MKMIKLECPGCGAELEVEDDRKLLYCSYCGKKVLLDNEEKEVSIRIENAKQAGYAFEKGRMEARKDRYDNIELGAKVKSLIEPLERLQFLYEKQGEIENSYTFACKRFQESCSWWYNIIPYVILVIAAGFLLWLMAIKPSHIRIGIIVYCIPVGIFLFVKMIFMRSRNERRQFMEEQKEQLNLTKEEIEQIYENNDFSIIPEEYLSIDALRYISKMLVTSRAYDLRQAMILYDDYQEEQQRKAVENSKASKNGTSGVDKALAIGTALYAGAVLLQELNKRKK